MSEKHKNNRKRKLPSTAWKKGQSGNPNGRPKKEVCIPGILREILAEKSSYDRDGFRNNLQMICKRAVEQAIGGDKDARAWVADRTEGKALERVITQQTDELIIIGNGEDDENDENDEDDDDESGDDE